VSAILGISAFYHDSAAAILVDGKIIAAAQEERFTRKKHTAEFPKNAIQYCLETSGFSLDELEAIVFYDKPLLKFERILETYYAFAPKGLLSFLKSMPIWIREKLFLKKLIKDGLAEIGKFEKKKLKILFPEHHLSHAASAFFTSPFVDAAILTIDGVGEWATATISHGKGNEIKILKEMKFPHSLGLLYSSFTYYLGFTVNSGEYKLMGLAPYGNIEAQRTQDFIRIIEQKLIKIFEDGSIWLDKEYFNFATGLTMVKNGKWEELFGFPKRTESDDLLQAHCDLALAIQKVTGDIVLKMAKTAFSLTGSSNLCLAGGVALNCVSNGMLKNSEIFKNIYIQPASGDAGGALGAALAVNYMYFNHPRLEPIEGDIMEGTYLGPDFSDKEILRMCNAFKSKFKKVDDFDKLSAEIADLIAAGNVIGWFQGRMEFGPRALGNRSIIADARNEFMQKKLNLSIKYREGFRPFAPAVLEEDCHQYFDLETKSPYMLFVTQIKESIKNLQATLTIESSMMGRLYQKRGLIPAVTHVDFSARVQTVSKATNPRFWTLIQKFKEKTGVGVVINTSFNVRGEPIVCTPKDAFQCFMATDMDCLVINNFVFMKKDQPFWDQKDKWGFKFDKD